MTSYARSRKVQLATHVPDTVIMRSPNAPIPDTHNSYGVVMFLDISGFTALCERYCSTSSSKKKGTDQLTSTLNSYLTKIVQTILVNGGDVLKFAGDALLAYWPCGRLEASRTLPYVVHDSLVMQSDFDNFETPDGVILRMKIAISVGKCHIHYIGNDEYKTFDITGAAIDEVNTAQSVTKPGTVVITKAAWMICDQVKYSAKDVGQGSMQISRKGIDPSAKNVLVATDIATNDERLIFRSDIQELLTSFSEQAHTNLKCFALKTVVQKIDHGIDVSWLSELRQVSVLFINIDPDSSVSKNLLIRGNRELELLQTAFQAVYPPLIKYEGTLNKVFMFDKGCTFLCIFGLPHATHEDDSGRAVRAAQDIFFSIKLMDINQCSIGVTTGIAFCGVVGHHERHEYTVIGEKVNMAARLMTNFPDAVTCDETTRSKSEISSGQFTLAPPIKLKGISNPENVYYVSIECIDEVHQSNHINEPTDDIQSIIGREEEMKVFLKLLHRMTEDIHKDPGVIVLSGEGGIGKTKLLKAMKAKASDMGFRIVSGFGGLIEQNTPFFTVKTLLVRLLELDVCSSIHEKEQLLLEHVTDEEMRECLPLLNDLLMLKFPQTPLILQMSHSERVQNLRKLLFNIVYQEALAKPCVFAIDDAHWMDYDSWEFILDLALNSKSILVLATRPTINEDSNKLMQKIRTYPYTIWLDLPSLSSDEMLEIACQMLEVDELDEWLKEIISSRSHGIPLWCEELVEGLLEMKALEIIEYGDDEMKKRCIVNLSVDLKNIPVQDSITGMVLSRIDNMNPSEQMVLKCAAIIGTKFHVDLLRAILPNGNDISSLRASLNSLAAHGIIECSVSAAVKSRLADLRSQSLNKPQEDFFNDPYLQCSCIKNLRQLDYVSSCHILAHQEVNNCQLLQFVHHYVYETALSLWTEQQFQALHKAAAVYLESRDYMCSNCGGEGYTLRPTDDATEQRSIACSNPQKCHLKRYHQPERGDSSYIFTNDQLDSQFSLLNKVRYDFHNCTCDESLVHYYPRLIHHWRAAGDIQKAVYYLTATAATALATFNNMEAISVLEEAHQVAKSGRNSTALNQIEKSKLECLYGQAFFQSGEIKESLPRFRKALRLLGTRLHTNSLFVPYGLAKQATKQLLHVKFPQRWLGSKRGSVSDKFLEQSRCLIHVVNTYQLKNKNISSLMTALHQVNKAEEAQLDINTLIDSYATMIKCCQLFDYKQLGEMYLNKALKKCSSVTFDMNGLFAYTNLLNAGLNLKLCLGKFSQAIDIGNIVTWINTKIHDVPPKLAALPLLFYANLFQLRDNECKDVIGQLKEIAKESDDLRAQAIFDCCRFEGHLNLDLDFHNATELIASAQFCCQGDVFHYDDTTRFLLLSCLSLWYCQNDLIADGVKFINTAKLLVPAKCESFLSIRGLVKFLESSLLLCRKKPSESLSIKDQSKSVLKTLKLYIKRYPFCKPQYLYLKALYHYYIDNHRLDAIVLMKESLSEGEKLSSALDCRKVQAALSEWGSQN